MAELICSLKPIFVISEKNLTYLIKYSSKLASKYIDYKHVFVITYIRVRYNRVSLYIVIYILAFKFFLQFALLTTFVVNYLPKSYNAVSKQILSKCKTWTNRWCINFDLKSEKVKKEAALFASSSLKCLLVWIEARIWGKRGKSVK